MGEINRINLVLFEKKRTNKWLAEQMGGQSDHRVEVVHQLFATRPRHNS